ncbi:MAG TPA: phosphoribosyltransferase [Parachlamydiales bacterium]|nr:phosphoribosyltransferase [Parachlamydiales bacterium]
MRFQDRKEAGRLLSSHLTSYRRQPDAIVLGLARGGVVVAYEVAKDLFLPLNVVVHRKIGALGYPELAIGAIAEDGEMLLNTEMAALPGSLPSFIEEEVTKEKEVQRERLSLYRKAAPLGSLEGKTILLVDDGVATGATLLVEVESLRKQKVRKIVAISPVASIEAWQKIKAEADEAVCLCLEENFLGISSFYDDFTQVEDEMILSLLRRAQHEYK